jgi:phospholipid N-methyltransferase
MSYFDFIKESVTNLKTVGTFTRSSKFVGEKMAECADLSNAKHVVELGAGDGAITMHILKRLPPDAKLYAFELNESFAEKLNTIDDDRLIIINDDVGQIVEIMKSHGVDKVDRIISAIPFVAFPQDLSERIIQACKSILHPDGKFIQIHYSLLLKKMYERIFETVQLKFVVLNIPPAWVFTCQL